MKFREITKEEAMKLTDTFVQEFLMKQCDCCNRKFMQTKNHKFTCHRCAKAMPTATGQWIFPPLSHGIAK